VSLLGRWRRRLESRGQPFRFRAERFGGIVQLRWPRALVFIDGDMAAHLGARTSGTTHTAAMGEAPLSAPLEAHLQLTNGCSVGCQGCYTGATSQPSSAEWGPDAWRRAIDELAAMRVFHLALGGGESADLPWLGEIAAYARERGLVPNLTTSGLSNLDNVLDHAHLFGQINVSIDGLGDRYREVRGVAGFERADAAVRALRKVKREVGINVVVTRQSFDELDSIFAYARRRRLSEVELLRFKPAGRGKRVYDRLRCTDAQHRALYPRLRRAALRHRIRVRVDCSYTPMLAHHDPDPKVLASLAVYGCTAGDFLIGVKATGQVTGCSFAPAEPDRPKVTELRRYWQREDAFADYRSWPRAIEPCRSCRYHALCRGGCKVVSLHVHGDATLPDPECPRVVDAITAQQKTRGLRLPVVM